MTTPILYSTWETNKQVQQDSPLSNFLFFHVFFLFHDINGHHKGCWPQNSHSSTFTSVKYRKRGELVKPKHSLIFQLIKQNLEKNKKGNKAHKKVHPIKQQLEKYKNTEYQTRKTCNALKYKCLWWKFYMCIISSWIQIRGKINEITLYPWMNSLSQLLPVEKWSLFLCSGLANIAPSPFHLPSS